MKQNDWILVAVCLVVSLIIGGVAFSQARQPETPAPPETIPTNAVSIPTVPMVYANGLPNAGKGPEGAEGGFESGGGGAAPGGGGDEGANPFGPGAGGGAPSNAANSISQGQTQAAGGG